MVNDRLDPLSDDIADLLAAERSAPGIPDVVRVRLSRRLADVHPSSFAVPEDASTALRAASARGHSTALLMAVAGMALVVGVGAGLAANGLAGEVTTPAVATHPPHLGPSPVTDPVPAPTLPLSPTPAAAPPALPSATTPIATTPIATTPPPAAPNKKRSAAPEIQEVAAPAPSTALSMTTPSVPAPAHDEPPPAAVDDEPASSVIPWTVLAPNLGKTPAPRLSKSPASGNREHIYLELAHDAVRSDDATTAIALVKAHKKKFPASHNSEKRDLLWIQALIIDRKYDFARERAEKFQRRYPRSRHLPALRNQLSRFPADRPRIPRAVRALLRP